MKGGCLVLLQEKIIEHVLASEREVEAKAAAPIAVDPIQQTVTQELKEAIRRRTVDRETAKICITFLGQPMSRGIHVKLKAAYDAWKDSRNDSDLVTEVHRLSEQFGKERPLAAPSRRLQREDIELICFGYLSE
jgi:hypothetical protein